MTLLPGVVLGRECLIGASTLVTKNVPDFYMAYGVPAKAVKEIDPKWRFPQELYDEFRKRVKEEDLQSFIDKMLDEYR